MYKDVVKFTNELFKKYGLHYEMRMVKDTDYGQICKIYSIPFKGRAKAVSSGLLPGQALEYFAYYYNGADKDKVQAVYTEFRNTTL